MDRWLQSKGSIIIFLVPALTVFTFSVFAPIVWSISYSFFQWDGLTDFIFSGLSNYKKMISDRIFFDSFFNTLIYVAINTIIQLSLGMIIAILLFNIKKGREFLKTLFFLPTVISSAAMAHLFRRIFAVEPIGILNYILNLVGLDSFVKAWASNAGTALFSVSVVEAYRFFGLYMVIYFAALISIPKDLYEAARIDGARGFKLYRYIIFPSIYPVIIVTIVMVINGTLKGFDIPYILTYGGPGHITELVATYMYKTAFARLNYGYASAIAVFLALESMIAILMIRYFSAGKGDK